MNNKSFDIYIDFGSSKIRAAAFKKDNIDNNFFFESKCHSNLNADYIDFSNAEKVIEKIIFDLENKTNEYLDNVNLMIDSPNIFPVSISVSKNYTEQKLTREDIQFLIQDAKQQILRNYSEQSIIHIIVKNYKVDNIDYSFFPTEIESSKISLDIIFICLPRIIISKIKELFVKFNISLDQISISSYAKSLSYKDNFNSNKNLIFIDIGFVKTSIIHYKNNNIVFFNMIPIGGNYITNDLSKILNISLIDAEKIKLYFDTNQTIIKDKKLSLDLIKKIIFARIEEILELSINPIRFKKNLTENNILKIILMGEGSRILDNKFKDKISFDEKIDLLDETVLDICGSALKLNEGINKQEIVIVPKKQKKIGIFERFFHFFS
jgi:cell division protein FtsA